MVTSNGRLFTRLLSDQVCQDQLEAGSLEVGHQQSQAGQDCDHIPLVKRRAACKWTTTLTWGKMDCFRLWVFPLSRSPGLANNDLESARLNETFCGVCKYSLFLASTGAVMYIILFHLLPLTSSNKAKTLGPRFKASQRNKVSNWVVSGPSLLVHRIVGWAMFYPPPCILAWDTPIYYFTFFPWKIIDTLNSSNKFHLQDFVHK